MAVSGDLLCSSNFTMSLSLFFHFWYALKFENFRNNHWSEPLWTDCVWENTNNNEPRLKFCGISKLFGDVYSLCFLGLIFSFEICFASCLEPTNSYPWCVFSTAFSVVFEPLPFFLPVTILHSQYTAIPFALCATQNRNFSASCEKFRSLDP